MNEDQIKRFIELLIKEVEATGDAEGVWFGGHDDTIELINLLIQYQPEEKKWKEYLVDYKKVHKIE